MIALEHQDFAVFRHINVDSGTEPDHSEPLRLNHPVADFGPANNPAGDQAGHLGAHIDHLGRFERFAAGLHGVDKVPLVGLDVEADLVGQP